MIIKHSELLPGDLYSIPATKHFADQRYMIIALKHEKKTTHAYELDLSTGKLDWYIYFDSDKFDVESRSNVLLPSK